ncbi:MAG: hypothetical protein U0457_11695 [Candidatus Sericytochromatia bacterium]
MKIKVVFISLFFLLFNSSCISGVYYVHFYEPIYMSLNDVENNIKLTKPRKIRNVEKIYTYKNYLFISSENMGIHIIDNSNPKNPINKGFLQIPLNQDISIKNDVLYADSMNQIVSIDISNLEKISILKKIKFDLPYSIGRFSIDPEKGLVIGYKNSVDYRARVITPKVFVPTPTSIDNRLTSSSSSTGKGGSLARFSIVNDYLYTVTNSDINVFSLKDEKNPEKIGKVEVDINRRDIETIYAYKDKLFMGSSTGAYIYDNKNPQKPEFISKIEHIRSCDPIVVENDTAYITLRSGVSCRGGSNQLDVVDIKDLKLPKIVKSYPLRKPWGLAIKDSMLYVCDYEDGLKIFDAKEAENLKELKVININTPKDIILNENNLGIIISDDGIYEYDFSNLNEYQKLEPLSYIKSEKTPIEQDPYYPKKEGYNAWYKEYFLDN